jgi:hypothetical protein
MQGRTVLFVASVLCAAGAAACGSIAAPSERTTDTLTGTIKVHGSDVRNFTASKRGELDIKLVSLTPSFASPIAIQLAQQIAGNCSYGGPLFVLVGANTSYGLIDPGVYCVALSDTGTMTVDENYTITITHP